MKAILLKEFGGPEQMYLGDYSLPEPGPRQLLVQVAATALNRADLLQRQGHYPPPAGESPVLGLEMAGVVSAIGSEVRHFQPGDRVCALLAGGGYATHVLVHEDMALPVPENLSLEDAAAIPEAFLTAFQALRWLAHVEEEEWVLIHAGASGVGTAAIQLVREMGARSMVTASAAKHGICLELGAHAAIDYRHEDFRGRVPVLTGGDGVDVVIDFLGATYLQGNIDVLRTDGRLVLLALLGGAQIDQLHIGGILRKRLQIIGSTLRNRSLDYKIELTRAFREFAWPRFRKGSLRPVVDRTFHWTEVAEAHRYMESNQNQGKIVLRIEE